MDICEINIPHENPFVEKYINQGAMADYFSYDIHDPNHVQVRLEEVKKQFYPREALEKYLLAFHERFQPSEKTVANIRALAHTDTFVVVGGQQAGLLTGPLYTIHKIITIIQLAKKYEAQLGVKVIPMFWVAGEDHDIEEINYVHVSKNNRLKKQRLYSTGEKHPASETPLDKEQVAKWLKEVMQAYGEATYTREIKQLLRNSLETSTTYVDFFIQLILQLFAKQGLVVMDSGDQGLRQIEAPFFQQLITKNDHIMDAFVTQQAKLKQAGFAPLIQTNERTAHLFYHEDGNRYLLEKNEWNQFVTKDGKIIFSKEELLEIAKNHPEKLSNNVVTRPLMQEYLLPNLAFVAGPGEIAYWGELKEVFQVSNIPMPPVIPRQMITFVERHIAEKVTEVGMSMESVLTRSVKEQKENWLKSQVDYLVEAPFVETKEAIKEIHTKLQAIATKTDKGLTDVARKNEQKVLEQITFLEKKINLSIEERHVVGLKKFQQIEMSLRPETGFQERVWNIFYYLNKYGVCFLEELTNAPFSLNYAHKVVLL